MTALLFLRERRSDASFDLCRILDTVQVFRHSDKGWRIHRRNTAPLHEAD